MLGKTHLAVGIATTMVIMRPTFLPELVVGLGAASVGAVISDIDVGTTEAHKDADVITAMAVASIVAVGLLEKFFNLGITNRIMADSNMFRIVAGILVFIGVCAVGKQMPHRSMMHSILALVLLSVCIYAVFPMAAPYFAIAFASHLVTDLFNFKKVMLLYPIKGGICLKLFHAKGIGNTVLFLAGSAIAAIEVLILLMRIIANR